MARFCKLDAIDAGLLIMPICFDNHLEDWDCWLRFVKKGLGRLPLINVTFYNSYFSVSHDLSLYCKGFSQKMTLTAVLAVRDVNAIF